MKYQVYMQLQYEIQYLEAVVSVYEHHIRLMEEMGENMVVLGIGYNVFFDNETPHKKIEAGVMALDCERSIPKQYIIDGLTETLEVSKKELESLKLISAKAKVTV